MDNPQSNTVLSIFTACSCRLSDIRKLFHDLSQYLQLNDLFYGLNFSKNVNFTIIDWDNDHQQDSLENRDENSENHGSLRALD